MKEQKHTLEYIKRQARNLKKEKGITHTEALELISKSLGFSNWIHCRRSLSGEGIPEAKKSVEIFELSFTDWLKRHKNRDSPLGDLASDMLKDDTWPLSASFEEYLSHIGDWKRGAGAALERAWKRYHAYLKEKNSPNPVKRKPRKLTPKKHDPRKITYVKGASPIPYPKRTKEKFSIGDKAWISWDGQKAHPVTITEVDVRHYSFIIERPLKHRGGQHYLRLDEVRSTPALACRNYVI